MTETPSSLVEWLINLENSPYARSHVTLSEIIERAREARASEKPPRTAVEKAERSLDEIGLRLATWCPHGFDSARVNDYYMAGELRTYLDDVREALGLDRKHGKRDGSTS